MTDAKLFLLFLLLANSIVFLLATCGKPKQNATRINQRRGTVTDRKEARRIAQNQNEEV